MSITAKEIIEALAFANGGYSQVPDEEIGVAIFRQIRNGSQIDAYAVMRDAAQIIAQFWNLNDDKDTLYRIEKGYEEISR